MRAMTDTTVTKLCGAFTLLSAVLGLVGVPIAMSIGYPIFADFGDGDTLLALASSWPAPLLFGVLQIALPTLMLGGTLGYFYLLKDGGALVVLGVVLACSGLVFTIAQDGIEVALVDALPRAYAAADAAARPGLLAVGAAGTSAIGVFGRLGIVALIGTLLLALSMWRLRRWRWIAGLYFVVFALTTVANTLATLVAPLAIAFPLGYTLLRVYLLAIGIVMWRWRPNVA
jgi:hypothetical protein